MAVGLGMLDDISFGVVPDAGGISDGDFAEVAALCALCDGEFDPPLSTRKSTTQSELSGGSGSLSNYLSALRGQSFVLARLDGRVVGFLSWVPEKSLSALGGGKFAYVTTVIVSPQMRSEGIGHALYREFVAKTRGLPPAVRTWSSNRAHVSLLGSLGWRESARLADDREPGVDTVYYTLEQKGQHMKLRLNMTDDVGYVPAYAHDGDAGIDLRAVEDYDIAPGESALVRTGVRAEIPAGHFGLECPRSGLGAKGITMRNAVGIVDSGYRGEILCALWNTTDETFHVSRHDRICQLVIVPCVRCDVVADAPLAASDRGTDGYGSTGVK